VPALPTAAADVVVDGASIDDRFMEQLLEVQVRDNVLLPDTAVVRLRDPDGELIDSHPFKLGGALEIKLGARGDSTVTSVFKGEIVALEPEFLEGACVISVRAYDRGHRLNRNRRSRTFQNQSASDMVRGVVSESGLTAGTIESTRVVHEFFQQSMETDWEFCWRLAAMHDFEFVVEDRRCHFRARKLASPAATLDWGDDLLTFRPRQSIVGQVRDVAVANHDPKAAQPLNGRATTPAVNGSSGAAQERSSVVGKFGGASVVVADRVVTTGAEATGVAQSVLDRLAGAYLEADGKAAGNPKVRAGATVAIAKVGRAFSGNYVLSQTTHTLRSGDQYTTAFTISGRTGHGISDLLRRGQGSGGWSAHLVIAVVTNNKDPDGMGRVRVKFPALGDDVEGWWARVTTINAGKERGLFMLPEVNDEVVVAFEHGDTRRPLVIGSLYNGKSPVPADLKDAKNSTPKALFGVKSDDKVHVEGKQAMTLRTGEKLSVEVNRDGQGGTGDYLLDAKGNITDKAAQNVKVEAGQNVEITGNASVTIKGKASVTVEATGPLKLKGATVDIEGSGPVNVKGAIINLG
jgi:phage protein D/phage baseplate assembly protein gpV